MKKMLALLPVLVLVLVLCCSCAMAAGELAVTQENCSIVNNEYTDYIMGMARIENVGDEPIMIEQAIVTYFDEKGDVLAEDEWMDMGVSMLQPGEYTYAYSTIYSEDDLDVNLAADYLVTVVPSEYDISWYDPVYPFTATAEYIPGVIDKDGWDSIPAYMQGIITNPYEDVLFTSTYVTMTLLDQDGGIIYVDYTLSMDDFVLMPGSSAVIRLEVPEEILALAAEMGQVPTSVDVYACQW